MIDGSTCEPHLARQVNEILLRAPSTIIQVLPVQTRDKSLMFMAQFSPCFFRLFSNVEWSERLHHSGTGTSGTSRIDKWERFKSVRFKINCNVSLGGLKSRVHSVQ